MDLRKLLAGENLTTEECKEALEALCQGGDPIRSGAFLALLHQKGESVEELLAFAQGMQERMVPYPLEEECVDIVGTGGDGANSVNISTASALLVSACGMRVAKHGNRASSSKCGSADLLEALGFDFDTPTKGAFTFLFAPKYHPAMKEVAAVRKQLGIPTLFNLIGPLINPARPAYTLMGVAKQSLLKPMSELLQRLGTQRSLVFHGNGLDELSTLGVCQAIEVTPSSLREFEIDPQQLGFRQGTLKELQGGEAEINIKRLKESLTGTEGGLLDTLVLNAGVALFISGKAEKIEDGVATAYKVAKGGSAWIF